MVGLIRISPLLQAATMVSEILQRENPAVKAQDREKVQQLVAVYRETQTKGSTIQRLLDTSVSGIVKIYDSESNTSEDMNRMLNEGDACTAGIAEYARRFAEDATIGGSVHYVYRSLSGASYNRLYLAVGKDGKPFAFYDTIESGDVSRNKVKGYDDRGLLDVLLGSFAASVIIANDLGLESIAFGDLELVETAQNLGIGEQKMFNESKDSGRQKLGYKGGNHDGVSLWMMGNSTSFRTTDPRLYTPESLACIVQETYAVMDVVKQTKKSMKRVRGHKETYELYLGIVEEILHCNKANFDAAAYASVQKDIGAFKEQYHLETLQLSERREKK